MMSRNAHITSVGEENTPIVQQLLSEVGYADSGNNHVTIRWRRQ